jgi:fluoroacetyl-CoA thioesterase
MRVSRTAVETMPSPPGREFPAVLATARLVDLMELAAARLMQRSLADGESSVAVRFAFHHLVPPRTAAASWRAIAHQAGMRGRLHGFRVEVFDDTGLIASGEHVRAVVIARRVEALARRRAGRPAMLLQA